MRVVAVEDIVGLQQAASRLGVSLTTLDNYIQGIRGKHHPFPEHIAIVNARTKVWDWKEIEAWAAAYVPQRGGAPRGDRNGKRKKIRGISGTGMVRTENGYRNVS